MKHAFGKSVVMEKYCLLLFESVCCGFVVYSTNLLKDKIASVCTSERSYSDIATEDFCVVCCCYCCLLYTLCLACCKNNFLAKEE